jgi:prepilin peptidase CpaA
MQGGIYSYGLLSALAIALLVAAFTDLRRRQIDNWLNAAIALGAPAFWLASGQSYVDVGFHIVIALVMFAILAVLFALRAMGGAT